MRISDWSSDVCSSDLGLMGRGRSSPASLARPWFRAHWTGLKFVDHSEHPSCCSYKQFIWDRVMSPARNVCHALAEAIRVLEVEGLAVQTLRSEEHTSELQSLMRISYAVF